MTTETKVRELDNPNNANTWTRCFASPGSSSIIDVVHPVSGLTCCYGKTLADCQKEYPDAIEMTVDEFCRQKGARQDEPIIWTEETEERHWEMLEVLPPTAMIGGGFLVGEPWDHHALNGQPRYEAHIKRGSKYLVASRPMTIKEFKALFADKSAQIAQELSASHAAMEK